MSHRERRSRWMRGAHCRSPAVFSSRRSSTKRRPGKCSKCLRRSTKSCTKGEAAGEASSRACRMSASSGPRVSHIFGALFTVSPPHPQPTSWALLQSHNVEGNLKRWSLNESSDFGRSPCAIQDRGVSAGVSERRGLPVVCHRGEEQLCHQSIDRHRRQREGPGQRQGQLRVSSAQPDWGWFACYRGET